MAEWGYEFPPEWDVTPDPAWANSVYASKVALKNACRRVLSYVGPGRRAG